MEIYPGFVQSWLKSSRLSLPSMISTTGISSGSWFEALCRVSLPEHERLENTPDGWVIPMLAQDIGRIIRSIDVVDSDDPCSDSFTGSVVGEGVVPFRKFGLGHRGGIDHRLIISKYYGGPC